MRKGFTLVELSIVLVIVGLLVGGVLVGQSLVDSARVSRMVRDLGQYEVAVVQFRSKFKQYPGDSSYFNPPGNLDGSLHRGANAPTNCAAAPNATLSNYENYQVWAHLSQAKMISKAYESYSPVACGGTHNNSYTDVSNAGIVGPYTELNSVALERLGRKKSTIDTYKFTTGNFGFHFFVGALDALMLSKKLGGQGSSGSVG